MRRKFSAEERKRIFDKTDGICHLCNGTLAFSSYGGRGVRGKWEIEHSIPIAKGGTDHFNNLFPAHVRCNKIKSDREKRTVRRELGYYQQDDTLTLGQVIGGTLMLIGVLKLINNLTQPKGGEYYGQK